MKRCTKTIGCDYGWIHGLSVLLGRNRRRTTCLRCGHKRIDARPKTARKGGK